MAKWMAALLCAGCFLLTVADQDDFDLADALDKATKKPPPATKKPSVGDRPKLYPDLRPHSGDHGNVDPDFNLGDAVNGDDSHLKPNPNPRPRPKPGSHSNSGNFNDLDLIDGKPLPPRAPGENEHISGQDGNTVDSSTTAKITSPVVTVVVVLALGAVFGYTAYKKKQYCFKPRGGAVV